MKILSKFGENPSRMRLSTQTGAFISRVATKFVFAYILMKIGWSGR
jgi:hypothetical protein